MVQINTEILTRLDKQYSKEVSGLTSGGTDYTDLREDTDFDKYLPLRNIQIFNTGSSDLKLFINGQKNFKYIPAGTIFDEGNKEIRFFKIVNAGTSDADFIVTGDNQLSEVELAKEQFKLDLIKYGVVQNG